MLIHRMGDGPYPDWSIDGALLVIAGDTFDLEALSGDSQKTIDVVNDGRFVANIILPAREIMAPETEDEEPQLSPLAIAKVKINLWTIKEPTL